MMATFFACQGKRKGVSFSLSFEFLGDENLKRHVHLKAFVSILTAAVFLTSCGSTGKTGTDSAASSAAAYEPHDRQFFAMTTVMNLRAYGAEAEEALDEAEEEIRSLDSKLSVGTKDSEVYAINQNGGGNLSEDTARLTEMSLALSRKTNGAFDFTIAPLMDRWGFSSLYDEQNDGSGDAEVTVDSVPTKEEIAQTLALVDYTKVSYDSSAKELKLGDGQTIDFGGIAKGYASQKVMEIYEKHKLTGGLADLGGNVQVMGAKPDGTPWKVGIEDPSDTSRVLGILSLADGKTVITSGGYERYLKDKDGNVYHHILDPKTGYPASNGLTSVSIIMDDGTEADGLSTALYVLGREGAISCWREHADEFEAVFMTDDGRLLVTPGLADTFSSDTYTPEIIEKIAS